MGWWYPDLTAREKWREGTKLDFKENDIRAHMEKSGIIKHSKRKEVSWMLLGIQNKTMESIEPDWWQKDLARSQD